MKLQKVKSTMISEVGYDAAANVLHVKFPNGKHYAYFDVAPQLHEDMMASDSIGKFFASNVRGSFAHSIVEPK
jgi:hypothetical protein